MNLFCMVGVKGLTISGAAHAIKNDLHPTMKPVELVERAIVNCSKTRHIVLDPLGGSGATLIVADRR
ncbi:DNA methyltransferase [Nitrosomonas sp.]|uniref:DNA methyltransferase n=1 Tax=Nitrosomonas sp. TaxID=42353 RepID=UPI002609446A|nr:DNA methyltransferase [Nitrosomonas sp.]MCW5601611.1 hypothetical protein [Nitrosomonas sp.]